ncbi:aldo/keto reductase [Pelagibacterales bacterium SAG-MED48]|nr:aldo/keto reductase [Pelagibacterales bacterium SAG-MED48]
MTQIKFNSKIIIGTSAWGSKISYKKSLKIGSKLIKMGINSFDSAPNYGGGYSHQILNHLSKNNKINVDTKFGDIATFNPKEILKRIIRYNNLNTFKSSFKYLSFVRSVRKNNHFWKIENIKKNIDFYLKDLEFCQVKIIYLHSPPKNIINKNYLKELNNLLIKKDLNLGISWPDESDFDFLLKEFPNINLQLSLEFFEKYKKEIIQNFEHIYINSIFKNYCNKQNNSKSFEYYFRDLLNLIEYKNNYKIIIGINSDKSLNNLQRYLT